jgi:cytidine deaminase
MVYEIWRIMTYMPIRSSPAQVTRRLVLSSLITSCSVAVASGFVAEAMPPTNHELALNALKSFSPLAQEILRTTLNDKGFRGQISASSVKELLTAVGNNTDAFMLSLLPVARTFSRPPLSNYLVGAVLRGASGSLYLGANIEVPGQPLGLAVHAEQAAVANAYMCGENGVSAIAVTAAPCGHCRQFLNELSPSSDIRVLRTDAPPMPLSALLPMAFGPKDLGFADGALPAKDTPLVLLSSAHQDPQTTLALNAARKAYSPYTKSPSGVAIRTLGGRDFSGSYIENAAFNPSLPPLQAALAGLFAAGLDAAAISRAVLVEVEGAPISQESGIRATLSALAPNVHLEVFKAKGK